MTATLSPRALGLAVTPNLRILDVGLAAKLCYESVITK